MGDLTVTLDGRPLIEFGAHTPPTVTTTHRGSGVCSWRMDPDRHRNLTGLVGAPVTVTPGGGPIWAGQLDEPGADGEYHALGLPTLADETPAVDATGAPSNAEQAVINAALARGALHGWQPPVVDIPNIPGDPDPGRTIAGLLDEATLDDGRHWRLSPRGTLTTYPAAPGEPDWVVRVPGYRYGYATDNLATHLMVRHMTGPGAYATLTVPTQVPGLRRERRLDLTGRGILTSAQARTVALGVAERQGYATPRPTERVEIAPGALQTIGGTVVPSWMGAGGDVFRLLGASDGRSGSLQLDVRAAEVEYDDATGVAVMVPAFMEPDGFETAAQAALSN